MPACRLDLPTFTVSPERHASKPEPTRRRFAVRVGHRERAPAGQMSTTPTATCGPAAPPTSSPSLSSRPWTSSTCARCAGACRTRVCSSSRSTCGRYDGTQVRPDLDGLGTCAPSSGDTAHSSGTRDEAYGRLTGTDEPTSAMTPGGTPINMKMHESTSPPGDERRPPTPGGCCIATQPPAAHAVTTGKRRVD